MSKIICDICGTSYPETAEQCPICGFARDMGVAAASEDVVVELPPQPAEKTHVKGGRFSAANVRKRNNSTPHYQPQLTDDEDDNYKPRKENGDGSNKPLVIILIILIAAIVVVSGFLFAKYFLPNVSDDGEETTGQTEEKPTESEETEEPTIPCTSLVLLDGESKELEEEGQRWLINVDVQPADTTDVLTFASSDESVVTVNEEGRIEAVGEGEATITITCGSQMLEFEVICVFEPETEPTTEPEPTEPEPTEPPLKDVTLKIKGNTDVTFRKVGTEFTFRLDGLANNEVTWTSQDESVVKVDAEGNMVTTGYGKAIIVVQYGEQKVEIIVRVNK